MSKPTPSKSSNDKFKPVLKILRYLAKKSAGGDYIYRGEPECYKKVSSTLYRHFEEEFKPRETRNKMLKKRETRNKVLKQWLERGQLNMTIFQEETVKEARPYSDEKDDFEISTELQHFGGKTNLIDFTDDYLVALFLCV